ncbi:MAG: DUF6165 family protein [Caulobacterales bacterium]
MDIVARSAWFTIAQATEWDEIIVCPDEVLVIAQDETGRILLIEEPSPAFDTNVLLLPGGVVEAHEALIETAQRELREETGRGAHHLSYVGALRPWSKYLKVVSHVVFAEDLYSAPLAKDEAHEIKTRPVALADLRAAIAAGEVQDARLIAGLALCFDANGARNPDVAPGGGRPAMSKTPLAPVSIGELIDKITILQIKTERIGDPAKLANVRTELSALNTALAQLGPLPDEVAEVTRDLSAVNTALWEIEDDIRLMEARQDFGPGFVELARAVYKQNDRRAALKRRINRVTGSTLIEEKSH